MDKNISKATVAKRIKALLEAAEKASSKSSLAVLRNWKRIKSGDPLAKTEIRQDDSGNHYVSITVISHEPASLDELTKAVTDAINNEGLPQWMVRSGGRIRVEIEERGPGTDAECWHFYGR
jgi:hypothetical protein